MRIIGAAVVMGAAIVGVFALYRSDIFLVTSIRVEGARSLGQDSVIGMADVPASATLLRLPVEAVEERLEASPWISAATVSRDFPHTVVLRITERTPVAILDLGEGGRWLIDEGLWVVAEASTESSGTLPVVRDTPGVEPTQGERIDSSVVANAVAVLRGMSPELRAMMRVMSAPSADLTSIYTTDDVQVFLGSAEDISRKDLVARQLLGQRAGPLLYVNVRDPDRPTVREMDSE